MLPNVGALADETCLVRSLRTPDLRGDLVWRV